MYLPRCTLFLSIVSLAILVGEMLGCYVCRVLCFQRILSVRLMPKILFVWFFMKMQAHRY